MSALEPALLSLVEGRQPDPFTVLGKHRQGDREVVRAFLPGAVTAMVVETGQRMQRLGDSDLFEWCGATGSAPRYYRLNWRDTRGEHTAYDPYCFSPQLGEMDLHLFGEGRHFHAYRFLGGHPHVADGVSGVLFAVWAPNAGRVSVIGDFNDWNGLHHPMRQRGDVWELFIPGLGPGALYKYEIRNRHHGNVQVKTDPYGNRFELRPATSSIVEIQPSHVWGDGAWMAGREAWDWLGAPLAIYEAHLGSWRLGANDQALDYRELAERMVAYVSDLGFTHIELMPITEHPLDESWGYQTTGYFAPTSRFGGPDDFRWFVDHCHQHGIGVIMDWAPAHFPRDAFALARFDGDAVYEHADPRQGEHRDWGTLIFNYGRNQVKNFLLANAVYWLEEFHVDGLRVDAVASMLYLDYSRKPGDWLPNRFGGNENLEAISFLRELNEVVHGQFPGVLMIAEESTAWPQVTRPAWVGGLGFSMKWNMGWMHDTLQYISKDPIYRSYHHDLLTFGLLYAFSENFVLPFSHDEVVHGKHSLLDKMPGDSWQRFANLRLLYTYQWTYPGKKLLFMGNEFAHGREWNATAALDWPLLDYPVHRGMQALIRDLNQLYRDMPSLHRCEFEHRGFEWIDCHDARQSTVSYLRKDGDDVAVVLLNFTPVVRHQYRIGVPEAGDYEEVFNSDSAYYGGGNVGNGGALRAEDTSWMGRPYSLVVTLPPLAGLVFRRQRTTAGIEPVTLSDATPISAHPKEIEAIAPPDATRVSVDPDAAGD